mgnify:CR=1 FL=1
MPKINTWDLAVETVEKKGEHTYRLGRAEPIEVSGTLPPILYNKETQKVYSKGGEVVEVDMPYGFAVKAEPWDFAPIGTSEGDQKSKIQARRARALIRYAENEAED